MVPEGEIQPSTVKVNTHLLGPTASGKQALSVQQF